MGLVDGEWRLPQWVHTLARAAWGFLGLWSLLLPCGMWLWLKECNRICISVGTVTFGVEADGAGQGSEEPALSLEWTVSRCKARLRDVAVGAKLNRRLGLDREGMPG